MVDVGAVSARDEYTLHAPSEERALRSPDLVTIVRGAASVLGTAWDRVVQDLIRCIVGTDGLRVLTPINLRDEGGTFAELLLEFEGARIVEVELVVVGADDEIVAVRRELEILDPLLADLLVVDHLPVG